MKGQRDDAFQNTKEGILQTETNDQSDTLCSSAAVEYALNATNLDYGSNNQIVDPPKGGGGANQVTMAR